MTEKPEPLNLQRLLLVRLILQLPQFFENTSRFSQGDDSGQAGLFSLRPTTSAADSFAKVPFQLGRLSSITQGQLMLNAEITYMVDDATGRIELKIAPAVDGLEVTLIASIVTETRHVPQYVAWSESGFAMVAAALAAFSDELTGEDGMFTGAEVRISPYPPTAGDGDVKPFCVATLTCAATGNRLVVDGPVLRMTKPVNGLEIPGNLHELLVSILTACDATIGKSEPPAGEVPIYARQGGDDEFVFISELSDAVRPWFVTHANLTNPGALQRDGQTATAQSYRDFCAGVQA